MANDLEQFTKLAELGKAVVELVKEAGLLRKRRARRTLTRKRGQKRAVAAKVKAPRTKGTPRSNAPLRGLTDTENE